MSKIASLFGGGDDSAKKAAEQARQDEIQRQAKLTSGKENISSAFSGFDDDYYSGVSSDYLNWALPQLEKQASDAKKALIYALSRGGNLSSSSAAEKQAALAEEYARNKQLLESKAVDFSTGQKQSVENARSNLLSTLTATEDPDVVGESAIRQAQTLSAAPTYDPLGSLFTDIAGTVSKINSARNLASGISSGGGSSLFSTAGSGRVVS